MVCFHGIHVIVTKSLGGGTWGEALLKQHDIPLSSGSFLRPCLASLWVDETLGQLCSLAGYVRSPAEGGRGRSVGRGQRGGGSRFPPDVTPVRNLWPAARAPPLPACFLPHLCLAYCPVVPRFSEDPAVSGNFQRRNTESQSSFCREGTGSIRGKGGRADSSLSRWEQHAQEGNQKKKSERDVNKNKYEARNKERKQGREQEGEARGPGGRPPSLPLAAPPAPTSADLIHRLVLPA